MCFLKIITTNLIAKDMGSDSQNRHTASVTVIQAINQMQITGTTTPRTHSQRSGQMCFRAGRERSNFLVTHWDPNDVLPCANSVYNAAEGVSSDTKDAFYPGCYQRFY